ncbi:MAG TPA: phosphomannomutase/phosphoglucomutase [bacterium]|mgnify:CR=1 FL=1|nr:phosphomannomutase/phosphoglucomutase [bacterium]
MIDPKIFKAYDIRGLVGEEINEELAFLLGRALVVYLQDKQPLRKIAVAYDMRESSSKLAAAVCKGIRAQGVTSVDLGLATTPMLNFSVGSYEDIDAGVMVTASHNPSEYNGFKMCDAKVLPIGKNNGMDEIRELVLANVWPEKRNVTAEYLQRVFSLVNLNSDRKMRVVVDAGNGMAGLLLPLLQKRLPNVELLPLYWELDGRFPNHEANPLKHETLSDLQTFVVVEECDFGVAFDGDADRVGVVDDSGAIIPGDLVTALLAKELLSDKKDALVLYDLRSSNIVKEVIGEAGGHAEESPVGHAFIKKMMQEKGAYFAGELSSHFYYQDFYNVESAIYTFLLLLSLLNSTDKSLSDLVAPLRKYHQSGEINLKVNVEKSAQIFSEIANYYQTQNSEDKAVSISYLDGLKISLPGWWFNLRMSNTEPLLRVNMEADTADLLHEKKNKLFDLLHKYL